MDRRNLLVIGAVSVALLAALAVYTGRQEHRMPERPGPLPKEVEAPVEVPSPVGEADRPEPPGAVEPAAAAGVLHGTVLDPEGRPVAGARVSAGWQIGAPVVDGAYRLQVPPGRGALHAAAPGYPPVSGGFDVAAGAETRLDLVLVSGGLSLAGHVQSTYGQPISGARLRALNNRPENYVLADLEHVATDERGAFRIGGLPAGMFRLYAEAPFFKAGGPGKVEAGREDILITLEPAGEIEGYLLLPYPPSPGERIAVVLTLYEEDAVTTFSAWGEGFVNNYTNDPRDEEFDGRNFRLRGILPGRYRLWGRVEGVGMGITPVFTVRAGEATRVEIGIREGGVLTGLVVSAGDGAPIAGALVLAAGAHDFPMLVTVKDEWDAHMNSAAATRTDGKGRYRLVGLPPGDYQILVRATGYRDVRQPLIAVPRPGDVEPLRLPQGGVVELSLLDAAGSPRGGVSVVVTSGEEYTRFGETDLDGHCRIDGVVPGEFYVQAGMEAGGSRIWVEGVLVAGETVVLTLREPRAVSRIAGRLTREGVPVPGSLIQASFSDDDGIEYTSAARTDEDGKFHLSPLLPGDVKLSIITPPPGRRLPGITRQVLAGPNRVDLDLPGDRILLRVLDGETGAPIEGAWARLGTGGHWGRSGKDGMISMDVLEGVETELVVASHEHGPVRLIASPSPTSRTVRLIPAANVELEIRSRDGKELPSAEIEIRDEQGFSQAKYARHWDEADVNSSRYPYRLSPGFYRFRVSADGYRDHAGELEVTAGGLKREIRLDLD